jgi:hypothetical protein
MSAVKVLFSVRHATYVRHYESVLRALATRGHHVTLASDGTIRPRPWPAHIEAMAAAHPSLRLDWTPNIAGNPWYELATTVRQNLFHARFLEAAYADTPELLTRAAAKAPGFARKRLEGPLGRTALGRRLISSTLRAIERSTVVPQPLVEYLERERPDVIVFTPLVVLRTSQLDLLRAARRLGIPTVFGVASWDHLSSKGLLYDLPDRVLVWNETQAEEARALHRVPSDRVVVTGAQLFDEWFERGAASSRDAFCARVGLPADRPFVLYVGSALFQGSPSEAAFAAAWVDAVRRRPALAECSVLVRPHFKRGDEWASFSTAGYSDAVVWPPQGQEPVDAGSRGSYFDSLYHADAIVGLNTSALIEGAILGKPVLTILTPEFYGNQEGTIHFRYLTRGQTPLLHVDRSLADHAERLEQVMSGRNPDPERSARFVRQFVRPCGLDVSATERAADAIETARAHAPAWAGLRLPAPVVAPLARLAVERMVRIREARERERDARKAARREAKRRPIPPAPAAAAASTTARAADGTEAPPASRSEA